MAIRRETYRRHLDFIAVRRIQLTTTEFIEPGTVIDTSQFKTIQIQRWYRTRRIGVVGSDWANAMLADDRAHARPEVVGKKDDVKAKPKPVKRQAKTTLIKEDVTEEPVKISTPVPAIAPAPTFNLKLPGND